MAEITRLGKAMGCNERTFPGLAGMGDLIVTATSCHSRNNRCGQLIGEGVPPKAAIAQIGMVVEGINALSATMQLAQRYDVEMPITEAVDQIVNRGMDPREVVYNLMTREKASENPSGK
jgi:glycerol-3-phosphate dehydrogenase (NAD(P)+)